MRIHVAIDERDLDAARQTLSPERIDAACAQALTRTILNVRTEATKRIGRRVYASAATIKESIATRQATRSELTASLYVSFRSIGIEKYPHRVTRRGITARFLKGETPSEIPGAFVMRSAKVPEGRSAIFKRRGRERLPIKRLSAPSIRSQAAPILADLYATGWVAERLRTNLDAALAYQEGRDAGL